MFKKITNKLRENAIKLKVALDTNINNQRGDLSIFTTKLGLAVVAVLVIVVLIVAGPKSFTEMWDWFTSTMKQRLTF